MKVELSDLLDIYEDIIRKNCKNKKKVFNFEKKKMILLYDLCNSVNNGTYSMGRYNVFLVRSPKYRIVMSLNICDKIMNHYITLNYIIPTLNNYLDDRNVATRKGMGNDYGIKLVKKYLEKNKKYDKFYIMKLDIKKYFYNIDHEILISMIRDKFDQDVFSFINNIICSTNASYINDLINNIRDNELVKGYREDVVNLPNYQFGKGLPIGNMTSQFFAIFYLYKLDHYIIHDLHLKYYVRYMDDFVIIHHDKDYLNKCKLIIEEKLNKEYKLELNKKSRIYSSLEGFDFLGYHFSIYNKRTIMNVSRKSFNSIRKNIYLGNRSFEEFNRYSNYKNSFVYAGVSCVKYFLNEFYG